ARCHARFYRARRGQRAWLGGRKNSASVERFRDSWGRRFGLLLFLPRPRTSLFSHSMIIRLFINAAVHRYPQKRFGVCSTAPPRLSPRLAVLYEHDVLLGSSLAQAFAERTWVGASFLRQRGHPDLRSRSSFPQYRRRRVHGP